MGTQGPGRKRIPNRERLIAENDALNQIAREAEARLAAKRAARAEAREIRMKELERHQKEEDSERYSRHSWRHTSVSDDEERMSVGSRGSLRPSDYSGFLGSSSRASSRASSARASPVVEDRTDRDFLDKGSRTASTLSAATLASLGGVSSRRGSCDTSFSVETEASIREIKDSLAEAEDKYRKAMMSNAQLHNEKSSLIYQVETLKEELSDMEELLWEARRQCDDRSKELERERHTHSVLQFEFKEMKEGLRHAEELLMEASELQVKSSSYCQEVCDLQEALQWKEKKIAALERHREVSDIVRIERDQLQAEVVHLRDLLKSHGVSPQISTNGDAGQKEGEEDADEALVSRPGQDSSLRGSESLLELKIKKIFDERESLRDQVRLLKSQLDQNQSRADGEQPVENGLDSSLLEMQRDANRQISELKFKLVKSEQEVTSLEQNVIRLESQVTRYKSALENTEQTEDKLKVENRKLQRELRSALDRAGELETSNSHLSKRLDKMKASRSALLAQQ
ncbi:leucine-rich repeat flightless-interacting protein 2 isoform X2 [Betta splendens]|uniref:Leucine-rich repeat flightless-interacting protein 2 isoform X2 n=1 Tax=Betta splendens TaxID=158456 RepID=A0A9W2XG59_BETSP|nr:leucine-rich repeat flightless-interacting protein 2 isoform X2 [Betta splendens]